MAEEHDDDLYFPTESFARRTRRAHPMGRRRGRPALRATSSPRSAIATTTIATSDTTPAHLVGWFQRKGVTANLDELYARLVAEAFA